MGVQSPTNLSHFHISLRQWLKWKARKGEGFGAQGAAERPEGAPVCDHEPHSRRPRTVIGKFAASKNGKVKTPVGG